MDSRAIVALGVGATGFVLGLLTVLDGSSIGVSPVSHPSALA